ncbi:hypothetical protein [Candidatus Tisiphia endosymbiont of Nemotelus uliginosus]|uniref:hypothetical protein n=1 Tax=Candidatus Tisiphia endosymbiont of Nemotelus uliginosus TaxID=3077926 RepID=UPI0035C8F720
MRKSIRKSKVKRVEQQKEHDISLDSISTVASESSSSSGVSSTKSSPQKDKVKVEADLSAVHKAIKALYGTPTGYKRVLDYKTDTTGYEKILASNPEIASDSNKDLLAGIRKYKLLSNLQGGNSKKAHANLVKVENIYKDKPENLLEYYKSIISEVSETENSKSPLKVIGDFIQKNIIHKLATLGISLLETLTEQLESLLNDERLDVEAAKKVVQDIEQFIQNNSAHIPEEDMTIIKANFCDLLQDLASQCMEDKQYHDVVEFLRKAREYSNQEETNLEIATELGVAYSLLAKEGVGAIGDSEETTWEVQAINEFEVVLKANPNGREWEPAIWPCVVQAYCKIGEYEECKKIATQFIIWLNKSGEAIDSYYENRMAATLYKCGQEFAKQDNYKAAIDCYDKAIILKINFLDAKKAILELNKVQDKIAPTEILHIIDNAEHTFKDLQEFYQSEIPLVKLEAYCKLSNFLEAKEYADGLIYKNASKILQLSPIYTKISHGLVNTHPDLANEAQNIISLSKKLKQTKDIVKILLETPDQIAEKLSPILTEEELGDLVRLLTYTATPVPAPRARTTDHTEQVKELQEELQARLNNDEHKSIYPDLSEIASSALGEVAELNGAG